MSLRNVLLIAGARPNFMKIAPIFRESIKYDHVQCKIVHTGQHYDHEMSQAFFNDLDIPAPDFLLEAGSGSHAAQTAKIMVEFEKVCLEEQPDLVVVVGDVNSTLACSIVAKKLMIKVAHVEAGLRSFDLSMPEEINRMVTDSISDFFFVTEESGEANLLREGKSRENIHNVGHVMVDNLLFQLDRLEREQHSLDLFTVNALKDAFGAYAFLTLHRPSNVDSPEVFGRIADALNEIATDMPMIFPVHPRTRNMIKQHNITFSDKIILLPPLGFRESLFLWKDASVVITDSGGLQEETTALGVPCVTLRDNTERPITVTVGSNVLAGTTRAGILDAYEQSLTTVGAASVPPLWDGRAAERIWRILTECNL
jgi:UDP-N-acetylglucosamine 2-epimerase (non-hydrolysing)